MDDILDPTGMYWNTLRSFPNLRKNKANEIDRKSKASKKAKKI